MNTPLFLTENPMEFCDQLYTAYSPRIAGWRLECVARKREMRFGQDTTVVRARSLRASEHLSIQLRRGLCTRDVMANMEFSLNEQALLMGVLAHRPGDPQSAEFIEAEDYLAKVAPTPGPGQSGHCELDLSRLFELGLDGMRADLHRRLQQESGEKREVYQSFVYVLDGFTALCRNAANTALAALSGASVERQVELHAISDSCRRIATEPPLTFRDALHLNWFATLGTAAERVWLVGPGRLDRRLLPFYERDVAAGRLTPTGALQLLENLYMLVNEGTSDGVAVGVMVGGRDANGHDATNALSYLCLEALRRTRLVYPTVGVCWHEGTPEDLTDLAVELIGHGYSTPAFFGDETIQRGLRGYGVPVDEACDYINSACVEITPCGSSNVWVASPYFSICQLLLEEIDAQSGDPSSTFDGFLAAYYTRLAAAIRLGVEGENESRELRRLNGRKPFQSVFTNDCIERGRDIDDGGARYNWVECSFVGLANLADSLHVIHEEVYNERTLTMAGLRDLLAADFAGREPERIRLLKKHDKYGVGSDAVDHFVRDTVAFIGKECARHKMLPDESHFIPGAFCWIMHEKLGAECGATPDGRKAGFPFADGAGPAQGRESSGPTAAILSTTSWDASPLIGGVALNMKFNRTLFTSQAPFRRLRDLLVTYLSRGGFEVQVNVVDHAVLQKAKENPDAYRDLVVRIGGYTDYFTRLSPEMQAEVMLRTEYQQL